MHRCIFLSYYIEYVVNADHKLVVILILYIFTAIALIPMRVKLAKKFEKVTATKAAMALQSLVLFAMFVLIENRDVRKLAVAVFFAGIGFGGYAALRASLLSDIADGDERNQVLKTAGSHVGREGSIQGHFDFS